MSGGVWSNTIKCCMELSKLSFGIKKSNVNKMSSGFLTELIETIFSLFSLILETKMTLKFVLVRLPILISNFLQVIFTNFSTFFTKNTSQCYKTKDR